MYLCRSDCICVNIGRQPYTNIPMKRIYLLLLAAIVGAGAWGTTTKNLSLKYHTFTFRGSSSYRMWTYNMPEVRWSTSDSTIVTADSTGLISPIKQGEATITVETIDGSQRDTCRVIVEYGAFKRVILPSEFGRNKKTIFCNDDAPDTIQQMPADATLWQLHKDSVYTFSAPCGYLAATTENGQLDTVTQRQVNTEWDIMPQGDNSLSVSVHTRKTRGDVLCYDTDNHRFNTRPYRQAEHRAAIYQEVNTYALIVSSADTASGYVNDVSGLYETGARVCLRAFSKENYHFIQWNDGNRDNPRIVTMKTSAMNKTAQFSLIEGSCGEHLQWRYAQDTLFITGYGAMDNYTIGGTPWNVLKKYIAHIQLPEGLTEIGNYAFSYCSKVEHIDIPSTVTRIGNSAFYGCTALQNIVVPDSVTQIGYAAFSGCTALRNVVLSQRLRAIHKETFSECSALTHIEIPDSVETIGTCAFQKCASLSAVTVGGSVQLIEKFSFSGCQNLTLLSVNSITPPVIDSTLSSQRLSRLVVSVPCGQKETYQAAPKWQNLDIRELPEHHLMLLTDDSKHGRATLVGSDCNTDSVTVAAVPIVPYRFEQWSDGVKDSLRTIHLTQDTMLLAQFSDKTSGKCGDSLYWKYHNGTITISGKGGMYNSYTEKSVPWLPYKDSIVAIHFGDSVRSIGQYAFCNCNQIEHVVIPNNVWSIKKFAFRDCVHLKSVTIGSYLVETCAFSGCQRLADITLSEQVENIHTGAFTGTAWENAQPDGMMYLAHILYDYKGKAKRDTALVVRDGTQYISANAIYDNHIVSITLPSSLKSLPMNCVRSERLSAIYMLSPTPVSMGYKAFASAQLNSVTLFVPCGAVKAYDRAPGWDFEHIVEANSYNVLLHSNLPQYGYGAVVRSQCSDREITIEAKAVDENFRFVQWSDGNTDNPRTVIMRQDTAFTAIFVPTYSGICGDNLQWEYKTDSRTLVLTGSGDMYEYATSSAFPWWVFKDSTLTIELPQSLTSISQQAFWGSSASLITPLPDSVVWVGASAFLGSMWYEWQPAGPIYVGKALYTYKSNSVLQGDSIVIDDGTVSISPNAFYYTSSPTSTQKFSVTMPRSVTIIGKKAFADRKLSSITCLAEEPPTCEADVFYGVNKKTPVYVPASAIDDYKAADQWKEFLNIYAIDSTNVATDIEEVTDMYLNKDNQGGYMAPRKILYQGQVLIVRDGQMFTITGMRVR